MWEGNQCYKVSEASEVLPAGEEGGEVDSSEGGGLDRTCHIVITTMSGVPHLPRRHLVGPTHTKCEGLTLEKSLFKNRQSRKII